MARHPCLSVCRHTNTNTRRILNLFWRPHETLDRTMHQHLQHQKKILPRASWIKYEHVKRGHFWVPFSLSFCSWMCFVLNTCDPFTSAPLTEEDQPRYVCFLLQKKILAVSNIISWHSLNVIIYLLCSKQGQMLCQMHWQQEAYTNCEGDIMVQ